MTNSVLYHYTSEQGLAGIRAAGYIDPLSHHAVRIDDPAPVVWLTDSEDPAVTGLISDQERTATRISVPPFASVRYWPIWRVFIPGSPESLQQWGDPLSWYVSVVRLPHSSDQPAEPEPVEAWGVVPSDTDLVHLEDLIASKADEAYERHAAAGDKAGCDRVGLLVARKPELLREMQNLMNAGVSSQRIRAGWRTLRAEVRDLPGVPDEWLVDLG
ncbi:hypothetical protein ACWEPZ_02870 [Streptomyces sp. NPDC004288]